MNLSPFLHRTGVCNVKHNKETKVTIKLQQLPSLTNKHDEGFLFLDGIKASSLLSQSDRREKLCSCQNTWVTLSLPTPAPPPQTLSDSDALTSAALDAEHPPPPSHLGTVCLEDM